MLNPIIKTIFVVLISSILAACNLDVSIENNSGGRVISDDGKIDCPSSRCSYNYSGGSTTVTLTAEPEDGFHFNGFKGSTACLDPDAFATGQCTLKMNRNHRVKAVFIKTLEDCPDDPTNNCIDNANGDYDGDGISNGNDTCPVDPENNCARGDKDGDGIINADDICRDDPTDNCLNNPEGDFDNDGALNDSDVCPSDFSNICDLNDTDGDGIVNDEDVCPNDENNNCLANGEGDFDGDGKSNATDPCPKAAPDSCDEGDLVMRMMIMTVSLILRITVP